MTRARRQSRVHRGFTLIEAIAAIVVLSIAIPPMLWSLRESSLKRISPVMVSRARWLATEKLEDIIADRHSSTRGYTYLVNANYAAESPVSGFPAFTRSVAVVETAADLSSPGTGYKRATVTVGWTDATGGARTLSASTILTDY